MNEDKPIIKEKDTQTTLSIHPFLPLLMWYGHLVISHIL